MKLALLLSLPPVELLKLPELEFPELHRTQITTQKSKDFSKRTAKYFQLPRDKCSQPESLCYRTCKNHLCFKVVCISDCIPLLTKKQFFVRQLEEE
jgi:hypothetical protein